MKRALPALFPMLLACGACGSGSSGSEGTGASSTTTSTTTTGSGGATSTTSTSTAAGGSGGATTTTATGSGGATTTTTSTTTSGTGGTAPAMVTAADLLALTVNCQQLPGTTLFAKDSGDPATVPLCGLDGAVWFKADMDVDCDGGSQPACMDDPYYQPDTSATDSQGNPLDASTLPFIVLPLTSNGFDPAAQGIKLGSVAAVIYNGELRYGILGDRGPKGVIGEASYAMVDALGGDPDPVTGGVDSGVTYIVFTGTSGVVTKKEDHAEAMAIGEARAKELVGAN